MADKFDPYREALVVESVTVWPADWHVLPVEPASRLEAQLHSDPAVCGHWNTCVSTRAFVAALR